MTGPALLQSRCGRRSTMAMLNRSGHSTSVSHSKSKWASTCKLQWESYTTMWWMENMTPIRCRRTWKNISTPMPDGSSNAKVLRNDGLHPTCRLDQHKRLYKSLLFALKQRHIAGCRRQMKVGMEKHCSTTHCSRRFELGREGFGAHHGLSRCEPNPNVATLQTQVEQENA